MDFPVESSAYTRLVAAQLDFIATLFRHYSASLSDSSAQAKELNFVRDKDDIDLIPLLCKVYNTYTSGDDQLLIAEVDKYALQPEAAT